MSKRQHQSNLRAVFFGVVLSRFCHIMYVIIIMVSIIRKTSIMKNFDELMKELASDEKLRGSLSEAAKSGKVDSFLKSQGVGSRELTDDETAAVTGGTFDIYLSPNAPAPFPCKRPTPCGGTAKLGCTNPYNHKEHYYFCDVCRAIHYVKENLDGSLYIEVTPVD